MKTMKTNALLLVCVLLLAGGAASAQESNEATNLRELLDLVEQGRAAEAAEARQREAEFRRQRDRQQQLLADARAQRDRAEQRSSQLETQFEENELLIVDKREALNRRLGSLKELFGVLQQVAGDTRGLFESSVISAQYPGRGEFLTALAQKMGTTSELATIDEMERLWFEIQREMTESGNVARFTTEVSAADGGRAQREVIRVGSFNLVSDGAYLDYDVNTGNVIELPRQPAGRYVGTTSELADATSGTVGFALDPSRGSLLKSLIQSPSIEERIEQGGIVGYVIIAVGIIGIIVALERMLYLTWQSGKVNRQLKRDTPDSGNALGRVLQVYEQNRSIDPESLELKLGEAILKEMPKLQRGITFLKIIAVVAPLMGLLGTVTGMIRTFQQITLFGTGDPKLMAGGISMALVTTVLGLCVAIPTVLLHTLVAGRSKRIIHVLQEQAAGIIADRMERGPGGGGQSQGG